MKIVKGHYNGSVVVLDEPVPVDHEVPVRVEFPEETASPETEEAELRPTNLTQFIGTAKKGFATPAEVDRFIRSERDAWDS